jgi:hypothetical protein
LDENFFLLFLYPQMAIATSPAPNKSRTPGSGTGFGVRASAELAIKQIKKTGMQNFRHLIHKLLFDYL